MYSLYNNISCLLIAVLLLLQLIACGPASVKPVQDVQSPIAVSTAAQRAFQQALSHMEKQQYTEAVAILLPLTQDQPRLSGPLINLGIAYTEVEQYEKAEAALLAALKADPQSSVTHNRLGLLYRRLGRFNDAKLAYERALQIDPQYALAHRNLGILCDIYLQDLNCALQHFEQYKAAIGEEDKQVVIWLADIQQRLAAQGNTQ